MIESDIFFKKISILYETASLWSEEDLNTTKDKLDKLSKMPNINYYIKSDDFNKIINNKDDKFYLRLMIDSPDNYKELAKSENNDSMSISDSPGRNKNLSSKSSENIKKRKSKGSRRSIKNNGSADYQKRIISIKYELHDLFFVKDIEKHSVFLCHMKDNIIYCSFINDKDIKGSRFSELLTYEEVNINIEDKNISVNSRNIKILTFPIYFILQNYEMTIEDFISIIESIFDSI